MERRSSVARTTGWLISLVAVLVTGTLLAQPRGRAAHAQAIFDPFPDARAALAAVGASDETALSSMLATIRDGAPVFYFRTTALASDQNARLGLVRALARVLPRLVASEPFGAAYTRLRDDAITAAAGDPPSDPSLARLDRISSLRSDIDGYRGDLQDQTLSRTERSRIRDRLEDAREQLEELEEQANDSRVRERERRSFESARAAYAQRREQAAASIAESLPPDVRLAVARRLQGFLDGCADVSFGARTRRDDRGVTVFVRPEHESKSKIWKLCYRAGRRTTDEARRLARGWLAELARDGIRP